MKRSDVSVVIPTRGDQDLSEIIASLVGFREVLIWNNAERQNLSVYARYAMIEEAQSAVIMTQDDDCVIDDEGIDVLLNAYQPGVLTANMPARFRHDFYREHCLVGFGAIFDRNLPAQAFDRFFASSRQSRDDPLFLRICDVVFTALSTRHLVDVSHTDMPWASNPERMWKQPDHQSSRSHMLKLAIAAR